MFDELGAEAEREGMDRYLVVAERARRRLQDSGQGCLLSVY